MLDEKGEVLYVGKAKNLPKRVIAYTKIKDLPIRLQRMVSLTHSLEIVTTATEVEALLLENNLIKKFKPAYNILLKDDKSYPYILITKDHSYPRIVKHRGSKTIKGDFFGPFANALSVDETILNLQKIFQIRSCKDSFFENRKRPCLQYHIKRCSAPCVQKISEKDYKESISNTIDFLKGRHGYVQKVLSDKMQAASDALNFEEAAKYRDQIKHLTTIQIKQNIDINDLFNGDVIGIYQNKNLVVVQIFFFRFGKNFGTKSIFIKQSYPQTIEENLNTFLNQFYTENEPPEHIVLSHEPTDFSLLKEAFKQQYTKSIKWEIPKTGIKKELIDQTLQNAQQSLEQKLLSSDSLTQIFEELKKHISTPKNSRKNRNL